MAPPPPTLPEYVCWGSTAKVALICAPADPRPPVAPIAAAEAPAPPSALIRAEHVPSGTAPLVIAPVAVVENTPGPAAGLARVGSTPKGCIVIAPTTQTTAIEARSNDDRCSRSRPILSRLPPYRSRPPAAVTPLRHTSTSVTPLRPSHHQDIVTLNAARRDCADCLTKHRLVWH